MGGDFVYHLRNLVAYDNGTTCNTNGHWCAGAGIVAEVHGRKCKSKTKGRPAALYRFNDDAKRSGAVLAGCYTLQPASGGAPVVGTKVAFDVNDAGRVALGGPLGPEVTQIEGQLVQQDSSGYLLAVSAIRTLRSRSSRSGSR